MCGSFGYDKKYTDIYITYSTFKIAKIHVQDISVYDSL